MTAKALYDFLDARYPRSLSCDWDNDGIMCLPDPEGEVRRVLLTLDVTEDAIRAAEESRAGAHSFAPSPSFLSAPGASSLGPGGEKAAAAGGGGHRGVFLPHPA